MTNQDKSFEIARIEAFHVVDTGASYWRDFKSDNRKAADRFALKPGWRTVYGTRIETSLVKITLADGSIGWGEATEPICPEVVCHLAVELLWPLVAGLEFSSPMALWEFGYDLNRGRGHVAGYHLLAMAALDIAVWDALARRAGVGVAALAVETPADRVPLYLSGIRRATVEERIEALQGHVSGGLAAAKIFVDGNVERTVAEVGALRDGVSGDWHLMVDALWSFETPDAAQTLREALDEHGVKWLECPLVPEDLAGHVALAAKPGVSIALGEHFYTPHQSGPWFDAHALHVFQPDIGRTGISSGQAQARNAEGAGLTVTPHMGAGSPVVQSAALHFWAAHCRAAPCEYQLDMATLLPDVFDSAWIADHGAMTVPDRPGLGVEIDEAALEKVCPSIKRSS